MYIYVLTPYGKETPCKIGYSHNPERRAKSIAAPFPLVVKHKEECILCEPNWESLNHPLGGSPYEPMRYKARQIEKLAHAFFRDSRLHGEWYFIQADAAINVIKRLVANAKSGAA